MLLSKKLVLVIGLVPWLFGCVSMEKKQDTPATSQMSGEAKAKLKSYDYSGLTASDKNVTATVVQSILPGDPQYFLRNTAWAEYVIEIRVLAQTLTVKDFRMIGASGTYIKSASSFTELDNTPTVQGETMEMFAVVGGAGAITTGAALTGSLAMAPIAIFAAPVILAGYFIHKSGEADETIAYAKELSKRALSSGTTIDKEAAMRGSVFFPFIDKPRAFVLEYTATDGTPRQLRLSMARNEPPQPISEETATQKQVTVDAKEVPDKKLKPQVAKKRKN